MNTEEILNNHKKFLFALKTMFAGENGKLVAQYLKESHIDTTALGSTPEETFYKLGQKEFVQGFLQDATTPFEE